jgi:outer membrane protein assembly factor BamB
MAQDQGPSTHLPAAALPHEPTLLVGSTFAGSTEGDVALVHAHTGAVVWQANTGRELGTLAQDGERAYVSMGSQLALLRASSRREIPGDRLRRLARLRAEPAQLEARAVRDGALQWRRTDWDLFGRLDVGVTAGIVLVTAKSGGSRNRDRALYALDATSGAARWTYPTTGQIQVDAHRFVARAGRVYVYGEIEGRGLLVLAARSGAEVWRRHGEPALLFSPTNQLLLEQDWSQAGVTLLHILDPQTDSILGERAVRGVVRAVSDDGIAYVIPSGTVEDPGLMAIRLDDGAELWRTGNEVRSEQIAVSKDAVYFAQVDAATGIGMVGALEAQSGRTLWQWRTPRNTGELLALWGWRAPHLLAVGVARSAATLSTALARDVRGLELLNELRWGQWRHPEVLHSAVNAMWLVADGGIVFLGTRLGVFALEAQTGDLLWHALPTTDLSCCDPALPSS